MPATVIAETKAEKQPDFAEVLKAVKELEEDLKSSRTVIVEGRIVGRDIYISNRRMIESNLK